MAAIDKSEKMTAITENILTFDKINCFYTLITYFQKVYIYITVDSNKYVLKLSKYLPFGRGNKVKVLTVFII